jgi:hypothetical protein
MAVRAQFEITRKLVEPHIPLLLLRPVAADAVLVQKRFKRLRGTDSTGDAEAGGEEYENAFHEAYEAKDW